VCSSNGRNDGLNKKKQFVSESERHGRRLRKKENKREGTTWRRRVLIGGERRKRVEKSSIGRFNLNHREEDLGRGERGEWSAIGNLALV